ncbi:tigger transposable element-derived protein 6-like [Ornithodoros turicata]|uniref:tigger transposable element-derived protein 6-like n=1 Tax=Ornithodoros turicata TaxID=34597 RepID=UPI003139B1FC
MATARKRKIITLEDKAKILEAVGNEEKKKDVAERYGIPQSSLSTILKAKDSILDGLKKGTSSQCKRLKGAMYDDVDKAVYSWFMETRAQNVPITGAVLQQKAKDFACLLENDAFRASSGWLHRFKVRHAIVGKVVSGESASADVPEAAVWLEEVLPRILTRYQPRDVYNADESALFYQMLPNRTLFLKGDRCHGAKQSKLRITVLF